MSMMNIPFTERLWYSLRQNGFDVKEQQGGYAAYVGAPDSPAVCIMDGDGNYQMCRSSEIGCVEQLCMMEGIQNVYKLVKATALNPLHLPGLNELDVEPEGNFCDDRQIMMNRHCPLDTAAPTLCSLHHHENMVDRNPFAGLLGLLLGVPTPAVLMKKPVPGIGSNEENSASNEAPYGE
ncbi:MAG: hypothetical protein MJ077_11870 [Oscillospiraceae bacterium]|nr:hypothetical protein [Oscillospiraceae bacterium]